MLAAAMPMAAAGLLGKGVGQEHALQRLSGHDEPLNAIEIPARLLFRIVRGSGRKRLEKTIAARARVTRGASGVAFPWAGKDWKDSSSENVEVEARG